MTSLMTSLYRLFKRRKLHIMTSKFKDSDFIDPNQRLTEISDDALLYIVNNTTSNTIIPVTGGTITLHAVGKPGSIQLVSKRDLMSAGVVALWNTDRIKVSTSANVGKNAISEIEMTDLKDKEKHSKIRNIVENDTDDGVGGVDVSYKAKDYTKDMDMEKPDVLSGATTVKTDTVKTDEGSVVETASAPARKTRGRKPKAN